MAKQTQYRTNPQSGKREVLSGEGKNRRWRTVEGQNVAASNSTNGMVGATRPRDFDRYQKSFADSTLDDRISDIDFKDTNKDPNVQQSYYDEDKECMRYTNLVDGKVSLSEVYDVDVEDSAVDVFIQTYWGEGDIKNDKFDGDAEKYEREFSKPLGVVYIDSLVRSAKDSGNVGLNVNNPGGEASIFEFSKDFNRFSTMTMEKAWDTFNEDTHLLESPSSEMRKRIKVAGDAMLSGEWREVFGDSHFTPSYESGNTTTDYVGEMVLAKQYIDEYRVNYKDDGNNGLNSVKYSKNAMNTSAELKNALEKDIDQVKYQVYGFKENSGKGFVDVVEIRGPEFTYTMMYRDKGEGKEELELEAYVSNEHNDDVDKIFTKTVDKNDIHDRVDQTARGIRDYFKNHGSDETRSAIYSALYE